MTIRPFSVDRMRRHSARSTPDVVRIEVSVKKVSEMGETGVHRLFRQWMDKMRIKHFGKRNRIEFSQNYNIDHDTYIFIGRVVEDPYARQIGVSSRFDAQ